MKIQIIYKGQKREEGKEKIKNRFEIPKIKYVMEEVKVYMGEFPRDGAIVRSGMGMCKTTYILI